MKGWLPLGALFGVLMCAKTAAGAWSASWGGEIRERYESAQNPQFGFGGEGRDDYLLNRLYLSGTVAHGDRLRFTGELLSGTTAGFAGDPPPTQQDPADVLQAHVESRFAAGDSRLAVRLGRQQLSLGASRLVSVRESPNVRRAFDGARLTWNTKQGMQADTFYMRLVAPQDGNFDDHSSAQQVLWGVYGTTSGPVFLGLKADFYYLGFRKDAAQFAFGQGDEQRHSVGTRLFGARGRTDWNLEGVWQWGTFGADSIRAWTLSADLGYTLESSPLTPRLGFKADVISGDRDPADGRLGTFNPLYPRLPYFSEANLVAPANLVDVQPNVVLHASAALAITLSWNVLWKLAREDSLYLPPLDPQPGTAMTATRYIGEQWTVGLDWQVKKRWAVSANYIRFDAGELTRRAGGRAGNLLTAAVKFDF